MEDWKRYKGVFAGFSLAPMVWIALFFVAPMAIVWAYSFGTNVGLTDVDISGSFSNYARAVEPLFLKIMAKSAAVAALTTLLCLIIASCSPSCFPFGRIC
jgi:spermidine/putrescine transport system permease protein